MNKCKTCESAKIKYGKNAMCAQCWVNKVYKNKRY